MYKKSLRKKVKTHLFFFVTLHLMSHATKTIRFAGQNNNTSRRRLLFWIDFDRSSIYRTLRNQYRISPEEFSSMQKDQVLAIDLPLYWSWNERRKEENIHCFRNITVSLIRWFFDQFGLDSSRERIRSGAQFFFLSDFVLYRTFSNAYVRAIFM